MQLPEATEFVPGMYPLSARSWSMTESPSGGPDPAGGLETDEEAPVPDSKPNILVIWGDDIGITNLSCYSDGLMGYRTPNIDRIADEGMRFTDSYGEQSCTAGRASFITGQSVFRTGLEQGRHAGRRRRPAGRGPDHRRAAQAARLRDRSVRQEPPRRPERVPAHGARVRRVLRQPLPPQRRGGAGAPELAVAGGVPAASTSAPGRAA